MPDKESTVQSDPASVGQLLRTAREERGLTPEQAAYQSKVPLRLLQALEADDYRMLPDPGYLVRLLHEYATLLKLDPNALEAEFRSAIRRPAGISLAAVPPKLAPPPIPWKHVLWTAAAILMVTPLVFIALSLATKRAAERPAPPPASEHRRKAEPADGGVTVFRASSGLPSCAHLQPRRGAANGSGGGEASCGDSDRDASGSPGGKEAPALSSFRLCCGGHLDGCPGRRRARAAGPPPEGTDGALRCRHALSGYGGKRWWHRVDLERETCAVSGTIGGGHSRSHSSIAL